MPDSVHAVSLAWQSLWSQDTPYHLSSAIEKGRRVNHIWLRPLDSISLPRTGPVVLLNREPWGVVSVDLRNNQLSQLGRLSNEGFEYDPAAGTFSAKIAFSELKLAGDYVVHRGKATGASVKLAARALGLRATDDDDPNITLANSYQQELISSPTGSGRFMVGTYYDNNDAYVQCFQNSTFVNAWNGTTYTTNGKNTAYFAGETSNAASSSNRGSVDVNADPDYSIHSFAMQSLVTVTCHKQGNTTASNAASTFASYTQGPAKTPQTVNAVINTVQTTAPPSSLAQGVLEAPAFTFKFPPEVEAKLQPIIDAIIKEEDDVKRGILIREQTERPIPGMYRSYFPTTALTVTGKVHTAENGDLSVECTGVSGPSPEVEVTLGVFPGQLHGEVQSALGRANFLKAVLGKRVVSALSGPDFLGYLSRLLTLAAGQKMGPVTG